MSKVLFNVWYLDENGSTSVQPVLANNKQEAAEAVKLPVIEVKRV